MGWVDTAGRTDDSMRVNTTATRNMVKALTLGQTDVVTRVVG
jgi:hypothetical protein